MTAEPEQALDSAVPGAASSGPRFPGPVPPPGLLPGGRFAGPWGIPVQSEDPELDPELDLDAGPHVWRTLGYRRLLWEPGRTAVGWTATEAYCFPSSGGPIVQGGLVTALLDAAMGGATWSVLDLEQAFLTADLRVEFLRSAAPGPLFAVGAVVRRTRRVVFAQAELFNAAHTLLATSRCTQVVLPAEGHAGRHDS